MIICICANVSSSVIETLALAGVSLDAIKEATGACTNCMCCYEELHKITQKLQPEAA